VRLLLVDDDAHVRELLRTTFELAEVDVREAADTASAAEEIKRDPPDAIVLDVAMPGESGLSFCRRLKDDEATADIPVVLLTGSVSGEEAAAAGADAFLTKPFSPLELLGLLERLPGPGRARPLRASDRVDDQLLLYAQDMRRLLERERTQRKSLEQAYVETVQALTAALESRDTDTSEHAQRVRLYARALTEEVDAALLDSSVEYGFLLHDVGKIGIPDRVLLKPGPLDPNERRLMEQHTLLGERMLAHVAWLSGTPLEVVRSHHERWDGHGYPDALRGEDIPLAARIFALADALDAIASDRPYRRGRDFETAFETVVSERGRHFDPDAVDALRSREAELHEIYREHGNGVNKR
jgi:response regulator RpfG family c-di-GMP phosphodiesterase